MYFFYTLLLVTVLAESDLDSSVASDGDVDSSIASDYNNPESVIDYDYDWDMELNNVSDSIMESSFSNRSHIDPLIVNGLEAQNGDFPYQAAIWRRISNGLKFICGGSLISETFIVSAAQCFAEYMYPDRYYVFLGNIDRMYGSNRNVLEIILHPHYNAEKLRNDIALLRIARVSLSFRIDILYLPYWPNNFEDEITYASGWGYTNKGSLTYLQYTRMTVMSNKMCSQFHSITDDNICAVNYKSGTCDGDTGGPLVIRKDNMLIGIRSFGIKNGENCNFPSGTVFTRVSQYRGWIKQITGA